MKNSVKKMQELFLAKNPCTKFQNPSNPLVLRPDNNRDLTP
jgi:hypothetical protein